MYKTYKATHSRIKEAKGPMLNCPDDIYSFFTDIKDISQEAVYVVTLNVKNKMIDRHLISLGTVNGCVVHPRDVFRCAILDNATSIVLIHNHPSGDVQPSTEDILLTKRMVYIGELVGIKVHDHIIIGDGYYSFGNYGYILEYSSEFSVDRTVTLR